MVVQSNLFPTWNRKWVGVVTLKSSPLAWPKFLAMTIPTKQDSVKLGEIEQEERSKETL